MNTSTTAPRFRVWSLEEQTVLARFGTTLECYECLKKIMQGEFKDERFESLSTQRDEYFVDDVLDETEVNAEDFMEYFDGGERPLDLQSI